MKTFLAILVICSLFIPELTQACGITTHIENSYRAHEYFADTSDGPVDYAKLIAKHPDALIGGSPYPDAYYDVACAGGKYHDISEDTHWAPFINATVNYIRRTYPQPWDEATEKLVVFMFGIVSHQVADIVWHSLGVDQGFLRAMANINFHGVFDDAHPVGDFGGDVLTNYEMNLDYIPTAIESWYFPTLDLFNIYTEFYGNTSMMPKNIIDDCSLLLYMERYIPVDDLFNIYKEYYGTDSKMPAPTILECTTELYIGRTAEVLAVDKLWPIYAEKSPFLVDEFEKYFLGGVNDMAGWINRIWQQTVIMMDKGTSACDIPKSTLFLSCNQSTPVMTGNRYPGKNGYYTRVPRDGLTRQDFITERYLRGIRVRPTQAILDRIAKQKQKQKDALYNSKKLTKGPALQPNRTLFVHNSYARLGEAYAYGDLNFDGKQDLVVTAPGYGMSGSPQEGRVYIIYGGDNGLPDDLDPDLDNLEKNGAGQIIRGWGGAQSRLGSSVAVLDVNLDGSDDIAVGAPAFVEAGASPLGYNGYVLIYFGEPKKHKVAYGAANITILCDKLQHCNLGYSMSTGDVNNDGHPDLVMSTPYAPTSNGEQTGFVVTFFSSKNNTGYQSFEATDLAWKIDGDSAYGWYGKNTFFGPWFDDKFLFVNKPEYRHCNKITDDNMEPGELVKIMIYREQLWQIISLASSSNCSYSDKDIQSLGVITGYMNAQPGNKWDIKGTQQFAQAGWSADAGKPYVERWLHILAVSYPGQDVMAKVAGRNITFPQAGHVVLYNYSSGRPETIFPTATFSGDRMFGRFGGKIKFIDINNDGIDDLLIGAPFRSEDVTEEFTGAEQGQVFIYYGGKKFPFHKDGTADCGNSFIQPCPRYTSSLTLEWVDDAPKTRFGTNFAYMKGMTKGQLFVTAEHAHTANSRLSGGVAIFDIDISTPSIVG